MVCSKTRKLGRLRGGWNPNTRWETIRETPEWTQIKQKILGRYSLSDRLLESAGKKIYQYDTAYLRETPKKARQLKSSWIGDQLNLYASRGVSEERLPEYGTALRKLWNYLRTVIHRGPAPVTRAQIANKRQAWREKRRLQAEAARSDDVPWIGSEGHYTRLRLGKLLPTQPRLRTEKWRRVLDIQKAGSGEQEEMDDADDDGIDDDVDDVSSATAEGDMAYLRRKDPRTLNQRRRLLNAYQKGMILFPKKRR